MAHPIKASLHFSSDGSQICSINPHFLLLCKAGGIVDRVILWPRDGNMVKSENGNKRQPACKPECPVSSEKFDAVIFDMDGVLTATASVHASSWKRAFDQYLRLRSARSEKPFIPFDIETDYKSYVDGKLRNDGVKSFLESRGIEIPYGNPSDAPESETICGIGNLKNSILEVAIETVGVDTFQGSVDFVNYVRKQELKTAVVTASRNSEAILKAAGIISLFDVIVDGNDAARLDLGGKPAPDTFLQAAQELGVEPGRAVVVEDSISGIQAGRDGGFGLVIGVDHYNDPDALTGNGADLVLNDLGDMLDFGENKKGQ